MCTYKCTHEATFGVHPHDVIVRIHVVWNVYDSVVKSGNDREGCQQNEPGFRHLKHDTTMIVKQQFRNKTTYSMFLMLYTFNSKFLVYVLTMYGFIRVLCTMNDVQADIIIMYLFGV